MLLNMLGGALIGGALSLIPSATADNYLAVIIAILVVIGIQLQIIGLTNIWRK